jgi:ribosomal protein L24E
VGIVPDPDGEGYWLVATDGGVFAFKSVFKGSMGDIKLNKPMRGMVPYGNGYLMVAADGGIFDFSNQSFVGSLGAHPPARPIASVAALP